MKPVEARVPERIALDLPADLRFLHIADFPFRIQDDHTRVGNTVERLRHRAARVAGGRDQNRQRSAVGEMVKQSCLHASPDVLERQRRPVEQLQHPNPIGDLDQRYREPQRVFHQRVHRRFGDLVLQHVKEEEDEFFLLVDVAFDEAEQLALGEELQRHYDEAMAQDFRRALMQNLIGVLKGALNPPPQNGAKKPRKTAPAKSERARHR